MKKIYRIFAISFLFILFLWVYLTPKNYELNYNLKSIKVKEAYHKKDKYYEYTYNYKNKVFKSIYFDNYTKSRKLIKDVEVIEKDNYTCLILKSDKLTVYPLCKNNKEENIAYYMTNEMDEYLTKDNFKDTKYKNINIYNLFNKTYLIWNYTGLDIINKEGQKTVKFINKDVYDIPLGVLHNNFFVLPDPEFEYHFNKLYIYDIDKDKLIEWKMNDSIYFDSYILGSHDKSIYLFDRKQQKEYELVPHKKKLRTITPRYYDKGKWIKTSENKLTTNQIKFTENAIIKYALEDNKLYKLLKDEKVLLSNQKVKEIIYNNKKEVYYLVDDALYLYSDKTGEVKLISNFEWNFNSNNKIFVY